MAGRNIQIPNLPQAVGLTGAEQLEIVQGGTSSRTTVGQIAEFANFDTDNLPITEAGLPVAYGQDDNGLLRRGYTPFLTPDNYEQGGSDETAALLRCRDKARTLGVPVLISKPWTINQPYEMSENGDQLVIPPGVQLIADSGFTGDSLILVGDAGASEPVQNWSITGGGSLECENLIDRAIDVQWGRFARITDLEINGANQNAIFIGESGTAYRSYDVNVRGCRLWYNDVANSATSIALHANNASDCYLDTLNIVGYRKGVRTDGPAIDMINNHVWSRPVHGPLVRCFDIFGDNNQLRGCYADNPTNVGDLSITDVYGFYLHGFHPQMVQCRSFLSVYWVPDTSVDNIITAIHMDREVYGYIDGFFADGGSTAAPYGVKRYKAVLTGGTDSTFFREPIVQSLSYVIDTASAQPKESISGGVTANHYGAERFEATSTFNGSVVLNGAVDFTGADPVVNLVGDGAITVSDPAATSRDYNISTSGSRRWALRGDSTAEGGANAGTNFHIVRLSDAGSPLAVPVEIIRATGVTKLNDLQVSTSYANDAAAAAGGIPVGGLYRNGSVVQIRIV